MEDELTICDTGGIAYYLMNEITLEQAILLNCLWEMVQTRAKVAQEQD